MADVTYETTSLLSADDIATASGNVSVHDGKITMSGRSIFTYKTLTFSEGTNISNIKFEYSIHSSDSKLSTRYAQPIVINVRLNYRAVREDETETYQNITIMPYTTAEDAGSYKFEELSLNNNAVESISITVRFNGTDSITIEKADWFKSKNAEVSPETVGDNLSRFYRSGGQTVLVIPLVDTLPDVDEVPDGFICRIAGIV